jgi:hypothetical protein
LSFWGAKRTQNYGLSVGTAFVARGNSQALIPDNPLGFQNDDVWWDGSQSKYSNRNASPWLTTRPTDGSGKWAVITILS